METEIETAIEKHSLKVKVAVMKVLGAISFIVLGVGLYLWNLVVDDYITTSTGHYLSWGTNPYRSYGVILIIISILSLSFTVIYTLYLKSRLNDL